MHAENFYLKLFYSAIVHRILTDVLLHSSKSEYITILLIYKKKAQSLLGAFSAAGFQILFLTGDLVSFGSSLSLIVIN